MTDKKGCFQSLEEMTEYFQSKGHILIGYNNLPDYPGMVLGIGVIFNREKYELDLEWISFGLDLFGENLLENYLYEFDELGELLAYLESNYGIALTDIPLNYKIDQSQFPNPIKDEKQKPIFETAWEKFQIDFRRGAFLDRSLTLKFSSIGSGV